MFTAVEDTTSTSQVPSSSTTLLPFRGQAAVSCHHSVPRRRSSHHPCPPLGPLEGVAISRKLLDYLNRLFVLQNSHLQVVNVAD